MRAHSIPLPKVTHIFKSLFLSRGHSVKDLLSDPERVSLFAFGRWALAAGVRFLTLPGQTPMVWLPDYFCGEVTKALQVTGIKLRYYPVNPDLRPKWDWFGENSKFIKKGQVFILVHYFGIMNDVNRAADFCRDRGLMLLEDAAHCLPTASLLSKMRGDIMTFSPSKLLPLPRGGILVLKQGSVHRHSDERVTADDTWARDIFWLLKRLCRRWLLMASLNPSIPQKFSLWVSANDGIRANLPEPGNHLWCRLFRYYLREIEEIHKKRRSNYLLWQQLTGSLNFLTPLFPEISEDCCPQVFPVLVRQDRDSFLTQFRKAGIPAGTWPDLPEEILGNKSSEALWIKDHLITLPVHQDLQGEDILCLGARLKNSKGS